MSKPVSLRRLREAVDALDRAVNPEAAVAVERAIEELKMWREKAAVSALELFRRREAMDEIMGILGAWKPEVGP